MRTLQSTRSPGRQRPTAIDLIVLGLAALVLGLAIGLAIGP
jgi:hypothetical protein